MTVNAASGSTLLTLNFYPCPGQATSCATGGSAGNNANLQSQKITMPGLTLTQNYSYDHLNRLTSTRESGGGANWAQGCQYDTFGNLAVPNGQNTGSPALPLAPDTPAALSWYSTTAPNRIASWSYDNAGNVLNVGGMARSFTYDAGNRQVSATLNGATANYTYDGNGLRVQKVANGVTTTYVYDAFGNLAAEYSGGTETSPCGQATCYVTLDHLGSTRMITDGAGSTTAPSVVARYDYQPFGQEIGSGFGGRTTALGYMAMPDGFLEKYTGQARDQETGLDWFQVRQMSGAQGRFQSPDPGNAGADPGNPQTWNGFAYVGNNPMSFTDPSGMFLEATAAGAAACGPVCAGIGAGVDIGIALWGLFGFGGPPATIPQTLATPSSPVLGSADDSDGVNGGLGTPLGLPGVGGNGFRNCSNTLKGCPTAGPFGAVQDLASWALGYGLNFAWSVTHLPPHSMRVATGPDPINPTPFRFFGTYYRGPGGAGPMGGVVNGACAAHDRCYENAGINAEGNTNPSIYWSQGQVAAAKACNQGLYDSVKHSNEPGATSIQLWLLYGSGYILRPDTGVRR